MVPKNKQQSRHENFMHRLLIGLLDDKYIANHIFFKGGTCARMLGLLDRFSVDLDFDLSIKADKKKIRDRLYKIFENLNFEIDDESKNALQFYLKYPAPKDNRNTLKLEILDKVFESNDYEPKYISLIDRTANCQTVETMFSNKLVALVDRYEKNKKIAGRDLYDIHYYFMNGYNYKKEIIEERRGKSVNDYFKELKEFINQKVKQKTIDEDLNPLLENDKFQEIRKHLKREVLNFIENEISD